MHVTGMCANITISCYPLMHNRLIDSYAHGLLKTLTDKDSDKDHRLARIDILHRNFTRLMSVHSVPRLVHSGNFAGYVGLLFGVAASFVCVVIEAPNESQSNRLGRIIIGSLNSLFLMMYLVGILDGSINASRRWHRVSRTHLMSPSVTQKALELGAWTTAPGFRAWLREDHDLRDYVFGVLVDHEKAWQMGAGLGSSVAIVLGYGALSLAGLR